MREYEVTLTGAQPLIMHQDNVVWSEAIKAWTRLPANKKLSVAGDDRSPAWTWIGALYHDGERVALPSDNIMTMLREGGASVVVPGGRGQKTFKAQSQSGILPLNPEWPLRVEDHEILVDDILALEGVMDFQAHQSVAHALGFELLVKRARIGQSKHVRVRPLFREWTLTGRLGVTDVQITEEVLGQILEVGGRYKGLCDWRPSSRTPGIFGTFTADIEEVLP